MNKSTLNHQTPVEEDWWKSAVFYQIYPRSFYDANNDGIGDLQGVIEKLDHLNDGKGGGLGIDAIWFSPFFTSPQADFGYDVSDYFGIDPDYGSLSDFDRLVAEAHKRGMRIVLDLVLNHTSYRHPWFVESRRDRENPKADWYVWVDPNPEGQPPNNWLSVFGGSAWTFEPLRGQYYLHNFLKEQPDLNWYNPEVREALAEVVRFWMNRGVNGFRLDTVNFFAYDRKLRDNPRRPKELNLLEDGQEANPLSQYIPRFSRDRPENMEFIRFLRGIFNEGSAITSIGEIGSIAGLESTLKLSADYVKNGDGLHMAYTFAMLSQHMDAAYFERVVRYTEKIIENGWPCWSLSNHDCVRMKSRFSASGEREGFQQMMLLLMLSLRGTPILYYGEEVDMEEYPISREELKDPQGIHFWPDIKGRDGCRTPFPWQSNYPNQGFNAGAKPWLPAKSPLALDQVQDDPHSTLHVLREMLRLRKAFPALRIGEFREFLCENECYVFERSKDGETMVVAANFSTEEQWTSLPAGTITSCTPPSHARSGKVKNNLVHLPGCGFYLGRKT